MTTVKQSALVGAGAAVGALLRYSMTSELPDTWWALLIINALGCFLIGALRPHPFVTTGILGGFTSYSAFQYQLSSSLLPLLPMFFGCIAFYLLGTSVRRRREVQSDV